MTQSISYWSHSFQLPDLPTLDNHVHTEVAIIGAGIAGLTAGYLLLKEGKKVVILDRASLAEGQTCRTTGHLTYLLDDRFFELERLFGSEGVQKAFSSHQEAVKLIEKICREEHIRCDFEIVNGYLFNHPSLPKDTLQKEWGALNKAGIHEALLSESPFSFFESKEMLMLPDQAQFHPLKYMAGLAQAILKRGGNIYKGANVQNIEGGQRCHAQTTQGFAITSSHMIIATNTPVNNRFVIHTKQAAYRTYVIGGYIPPNAVPKALYYDALDPYHYVRLYSEPHQDVLLIGGEDHKTGQNPEPKKSYERLEKWARKQFPMLKQIEFFWSGQILEPIDGLAFLGKNPLEENVYIVTGDSGNGLTHGTIGATIITDLIAEKSSPYSSLYNPSRKTMGSLKEFAKENLNVGVQYLKWLGSSSEPSEMAPDSGCVLQQGVEKLAIYKDQKGNLTTLSAVCPHLGCIVNWNEAEKTWDCPCHGSRFDCQGCVLDGPATSNLKRHADKVV